MSDERRIMDDEVVVGLRKARALIENPDKWIAWPLGCVWLPEACLQREMLCAEMAVAASGGGYLLIKDALIPALPPPYTSVAKYNDTHTHAEVLALFDRAIAMRLEELGCQSAAPTTK